MKIYVLFTQREERYEDECAPEAMEVCDEFMMEENPEWMHDQLVEYQNKVNDNKSDTIAARVIEIDLGEGSQEKIREILIGTPKIDGKIIT